MLQLASRQGRPLALGPQPVFQLVGRTGHQRALQQQVPQRARPAEFAAVSPVELPVQQPELGQRAFRRARRRDRRPERLLQVPPAAQLAELAAVWPVELQVQQPERVPAFQLAFLPVLQRELARRAFPGLESQALERVP